MMKSLLLLCFASFVLSNDLQEDLPKYSVYEKDIRIYFHSQSLPNGTEITHRNYQVDMSQTNFDNTKKTFFAVHGWHNNFSSKFCEGMTKAYLAGYDVNVFLLDYRQVAQLPYPEAFAATHGVAGGMSKLITSLIKYHGLDLDKTVIVGHSLGAQISGLIGAALDGQVNTIIGLDPAGPLFLQNDTYNRLDETDAKFVMAVHTGISYYGEAYPLGDADYYANQGKFQPGCELDTPEGLLCDHTRSYYYFIESITGGRFKSVKCEDYASFKSGACANNSVSFMGQFEIDKTASGTYFFETNASPPFARS